MSATEDRPATTWPDHPRPFVAGDLEAMPDDWYRREIIDGVLVVSPAPAWWHQTCLLELAVRLHAALPAHLKVRILPYYWLPPNRDAVQPDVMIVGRQDIDPDGLLRRTPVLVVEVLSPSTATWDRDLKRSYYEEMGVPAYWLVDPDEPGVVALELNEAGRYVQRARAAGRRRFKVTFPFPLELTPADLLDG